MLSKTHCKHDDACSEKSVLPVHNLIHDFLLFACCSSQVNSSSFYALVPHKVSEQGDIVEAVEEVFSKTMAERVRINHLSFKPILIGKVFQLLSDATCRNDLTESVKKQITAANAFI